MSKILIADDEANILMLLEIMLKELADEVITAENGEIAIQKAEEHHPDLIITDVVMPKKNGFEVCRAIRNIEEISDTPIIILSALGDEYNKITGFEEGADDYLTKPFNVEELKTRAKVLLLKHQAKKEKNTPTLPKIEYLEEIEPQIDALKTGIEPLDQHLFGGLPKGSNILILGPLGRGKSSFSRQFLNNGLKNLEKCLWVALDDDPKKIRQLLGTSSDKTSQAYENESILRFVDAYSWSSLTHPEKEPFAINGTLDLNQLSGVISDASYELGHTIQEKCGGRRVIDSISSLLINFDLPSVQRFISQIARTSTAFGGVTTLFIIEEGSVSDHVLNNIKYIMDGIIEFDQDEKGRKCRVASMKWTKYNNSSIHY